jgi:hypothetical protein
MHLILVKSEENYLKLDRICSLTKAQHLQRCTQKVTVISQPSLDVYQKRKPALDVRKKRSSESPIRQSSTPLDCWVDGDRDDE